MGFWLYSPFPILRGLLVFGGWLTDRELGLRLKDGEQPSSVIRLDGLMSWTKTMVLHDHRERVPAIFQCSIS